MIRYGVDGEKSTALIVADKMMTAAKTAPKGCGEDKIVTLTLTGEDKQILSDKMRVRASETNEAFFERDANNIDASHCVVLIGVKNIPLGLNNCGNCGFINCYESQKAGSHCAFNGTDLGIAIGSAVSIAADNRVDNRVFYSAGKAALSLNFFEQNVKLCYAIPLGSDSKSLFFDRAPVNVLL